MSPPESAPSRRTFASAYDPQHNNFDLLRFALALLVLWSHSYSLAGVKDPLARMSPQLAGGWLGVDGFFVISGFLVTQSWQRSRSAAAYARNRALRVVPALVAALVLSAFVIAPLVSTRSWASYLGWSRPWLIFPGVFAHRFLAIPDAFPRNPFPHHVNASLWTLRYEVTCYGLIALLGSFGAPARRAGTLALFAGAWTCARLGQDKGMFGDVGYWLPHLVSYFAAGMCGYEFGGAIPYGAAAAGAAAAALAAALATGHLAAILPLAGSYLLLALAFVPWGAIAGFGRRGDFSYGLYVYAYPIQQLLLHLAGGTLAPALVFAGSFPLTLGLAVLSWHYLEAPALTFKRHR